MRNTRYLIPDTKFNSGFTLLELLVVITILGILASVGFGQYRTSQLKARDAQRKGDLANVARALEMYYSDHGCYPPSTSSGLIDVGGGLDWGTEFSTSEVVYMKMLPKDPLQDKDANYVYCYQSDDSGTYYQLYAKLQNENDSDYKGPYTCAGDNNYTYGIASSNQTP